MRHQQAYKYELQPNGEQTRNMRCFAGSCRFVFNKALALQKERIEAGDKKLGYAGLCKLLTEWRNGTETGWLSGSPVHPLQQSLKDLDRAYTNFFAKRADFPRFKKRGQHDACVECGFEENADVVGAINIRHRGMKWIEGQDRVDASAPLTKRARIACEVNGAVRLSAAGTHRSDSGGFRLSAVGISRL